MLIEPVVCAEPVDEVVADAPATALPPERLLNKQPPDTLQDHEIASCWPLMDDDGIAALAKSIRQRGQLAPIFTYEGKILDGRNRYRACIVAEVDHVIKPYLGDDPVGFAIACNHERRHQTVSQRAIIAVRLANVKGGRPSTTSPNGEVNSQPLVTRAKAAKLMRVGTSTVDRARRLSASAPAEIIHQVEAGAMTLPTG